ncbi:MAG: alpha/beta hydrolase [Geodermatophilaceae bacterium]|nr:alpha/beta hydrolase [Geodermatophilaceae bacterium]MDQ3454337.1 alpha/beta hydrolase [Actinomycetota bacterium]
MDQVDVGGLRIAYERAGHGPPLVLLHGFVGDGRSTFGQQIDDLSDEFTVVAWDGPGAGRSADPPASFRLPDYADCLAGFVAALELDRPHVVGLSYGAALALQLAGAYPHVPRSLVLAGAYAGWAGSLPAPEVEQRLASSLRAAELAPEQFVGALLPTMFSAAAAPERVAGFAAAVPQFHPAGFRAMARAMAAADLRAVLPAIDVPTLLLCGEKDDRAPLRVAEALHAAIPTSRLVVLTGVGHVSSVEAPERFNQEVRHFLQDHTR